MVKQYRIKGETWDLWWNDDLSKKDAKFIQENDTDQLSFHILTEEKLNKLEAAGMDPEAVARLRRRVKADGYKELNLVLKR